MTFTPAARALLQRLEGCRLTSYPDEGGVWTIGYGHTGSDARPGATWTQESAEAALNVDLQRFCMGVERLLAKMAVPLNDNQFSALVIFSFNVGLMALAGSTAMRDALAGRLNAVPAELARWKYVHDKSGVPIVSKILVARRAAEAELWNTPVDQAEIA